MAVRAGAPKPDISSVDALKGTLLQAKSIAYSASVSGRYLSAELLQRLGIADQIAAKSKRIEGERVGTVVARGDAEIGFQQVSELLPIEGIDYVGPLPPEVQSINVFSAGVAAGSKEQSAAIQYDIKGSAFTGSTRRRTTAGVHFNGLRALRQSDGTRTITIGKPTAGKFFERLVLGEFKE